jgi:2-polyprenyl-6-methoxyphenol hydroxylase-like FAD-dependent oxidoreductase
MTWGDRQVLLEILLMFDNIQDKSKILLNKNIIDVEHSLHGVRVKCEDKSSHKGDVLAGADGVTSKIRDQMWQLADAAEPGLVKTRTVSAPCALSTWTMRRKRLALLPLFCC